MSIMDGKVALVTGGSSGIGRASAVAFARLGAKVVVAARREDEGEETVRLIQEAGSEGRFIQTDVSKTAEIERLFDEITNAFGGIDYAFNNAGVENPLRPLAEQIEEDFDRVISINLKSVWLCMKHEINQMLKRGGGAIVNNSSIYGLVGIAMQSIYAASKHGVLGLTKAAAIEYAEQGIRINAVCPGDIETSTVRRVVGNDEAMQRYAKANLLGRWGQPENIAEAVVWLCSDRAAWIIGQSLPVDGGYTIQ